LIALPEECKESQPTGKINLWRRRRYFTTYSPEDTQSDITRVCRSNAFQSVCLFFSWNF